MALWRSIVAVAVVSALSGRCGETPPIGPTGPNGEQLVGDWSGPGVSFRVTEDLRVTGLTLTYAFPGCSGSATLADANVNRISGVFGFVFGQALPAGGPSGVQGGAALSGRSDSSIDGSAGFEGAGTCKGGSVKFTALRK